MDARTLAKEAGVYELRTQGCTAAVPEEVRKIDAMHLDWRPREEFAGYVEQLLEQVAATGDGRALVHSFASAPLPVRSEGGEWGDLLGEEQVLRDSERGTDSGIRILIALGLHGWDWWTAPGSSRRCSDGSGTWSIISVPFRRTFSEGQFTIHPAVALAHQLTHGSQMHQGRYDPRIAKGVIQTWELHHFSEKDMVVSELEARGKRQQLRHLTLGAKASRGAQEPLVPERTRISTELAEQYALAVRGTTAAESAEATAEARRSVQRASERTVGKQLSLAYQGPANGSVQYSYEVTLWEAPEVLGAALKEQTRVSQKNKNASGNAVTRSWRTARCKIGFGDPQTSETVKVTKPSPPEKYLKLRSAGYELFTLAERNTAAAGPDIKHWQDLLPKGSRKRSKTKLAHMAARVVPPVAGGILGGAAGFPGGLPGMTVGAIAGAKIGSYIAKPLKIATDTTLIDLVDPVMRHTRHIGAYLKKRIDQLSEDDSTPQLLEPADWPSDEQSVPAGPPPVPGTRIAFRWRGSQAQGPVATVADVPGLPGIGIVLDHDAVSLARAAGVYGDRTMGCTPLPEADRERLDSAAPGALVPTSLFRQYVQELFTALEEGSPSTTRLLKELAQTSPMPAHLVRSAGGTGDAAADRGAGPTPEERAKQFLIGENGETASDFKVLIAVGRHGWDWWTAPGDAQSAGNGCGTWSLISVPYRRFFAEGPYPVHPAVLLGHQLTHAHQIHHGYFDPQDVRVQVEKIRWTTQATAEHQARGVHPYQHGEGSPPLGVQQARHIAKMVWEGWGRGAAKGRLAFPAALRRDLDSNLLYSERKAADELEVYSQRSYSEKEKDTQELYLKCSVGELTQHLGELAKHQHPWKLKRHLKARSVEYEKYKLWKEGCVKKGITCVIRSDLLPQDSRRTASYQIAADLVAGRVKKAANDALESVSADDILMEIVPPPVGLAIDIAKSPTTWNSLSHVAQVERSHGLLSARTGLAPRKRELPHRAEAGEHATSDQDGGEITQLRQIPRPSERRWGPAGALDLMFAIRGNGSQPPHASDQSAPGQPADTQVLPMVAALRAAMRAADREAPSVMRHAEPGVSVAAVRRHRKGGELGRETTV
ncbi:hypothetical protein AB0K09_18975 [Streptomyces sp. NPDC049577]|uniref:hypothetical protein n=1 Tax=Streptomyces sp. NPDC049577 TaxID=3155153 RepID=UPI00343D6F51